MHDERRHQFRRREQRERSFIDFSRQNRTRDRLHRNDLADAHAETAQFFDVGIDQRLRAGKA